MRRHSRRVSPANSSSDAAAVGSLKSGQLIPLSGEGEK